MGGFSTVTPPGAINTNVAVIASISSEVENNVANINAVVSTNVNYPLSTMAATLSSINSYSANINAILTTNVNAPLSGIQNTLNEIEANATSINAVVTANVNYPLSTMAATLSSINSYSANINAILSSNVNFAMSTMAAALHSIGTDNWQIYINGASIMAPVDLQARYKPTGFTIYSGTVTSNGSSATVSVSPYSVVRSMVKVTSVGGSNAVLNVYLNGIYDATGDAVPLASVTGITGVGVYEIGQVNDIPFNYINVSWTLSGYSPSFTITVAAQAMV